MRHCTVHSLFNASFTCNGPRFSADRKIRRSSQRLGRVRWSSAVNTGLVPALGLSLNGNTTNNVKRNRFLCREYALCGFLVPTALRAQSSPKEAALTQATQTTWSVAGSYCSQSAASPCCTTLWHLALPPALKHNRPWQPSSPAASLRHSRCSETN